WLKAQDDAMASRAGKRNGLKQNGIDRDLGDDRCRAAFVGKGNVPILGGLRHLRRIIRPVDQVDPLSGALHERPIADLDPQSAAWLGVVALNNKPGRL